MHILRCRRLKPRGAGVWASRCAHAAKQLYALLLPSAAGADKTGRFQEAAIAGCSLVCLPECFAFLGGGAAASVDASEPLDGPNLSAYCALAKCGFLRRTLSVPQFRTLWRPAVANAWPSYYARKPRGGGMHASTAQVANCSNGWRVAKPPTAVKSPARCFS